MGIYCYTLRKNTIKAIDMDIGAPIELGTTQYAFKESWNGGAAYKRLVNRMFSLAEKARDANPNLVLVVMGDPKNNDFDKHKMPVFRVSPEYEFHYDGRSPGDVVGYLYKNGKRYEFERTAA